MKLGLPNERGRRVVALSRACGDERGNVRDDEDLFHNISGECLIVSIAHIDFTLI